jgi:hypothetical protein
MVLGLALAFVACGSSKRRRDRNDGGEGGEAGAAEPTSGTAGRTAGSAGTGSAGKGGAGGSAGTGNGEAGSDESGGTSNGEGGDGAGRGGGAGSAATGGSAGSDPGAACEGIECSGHGTCVVSAGVARCDCDPGYSPVGLECVICPVVSGTFDLDVPLVTLSGELTLNGALVSGETALVNFVTADGDIVYGGDLGTGSYSVQMLPGTYDLQYAGGADPQNFPGNSYFTLRKGVVIEESGTLDIDVPSVTVSGRLTVNGATPSTSGDAGVYFLSAEGGWFASAGKLAAPDYAVALIPGEYDIFYSVLIEHASLPKNQFALLRAGVTLDEDSTLDIDIPMVTLAGAVTVNGAPATTSAETHLFLRTPAGDSVHLGGVAAGSFSVGLVPGTFDLFYAGGVDPGVVPENASAKLAGDVSIPQSRTLDIDIPMVTVTGNVTVNGAAHVTSQNNARLSFSNSADDFVDLATTDAATYTASLVPGTYDLLYDAHVFQDDGVPDNQFGTISRNLIVEEDGTLNLDIPLLSVTGNVTVGGEPPSGGAATFYFVNPDSGDTVIATTLAEPAYTAEFLPGRYDVFYGFQEQGPDLPANYGTRILEGVEIDGPRSIDLEVPAGVGLSGTASVNGAAVPSGVDSQITLYRGDSEWAALVNLGAPSFDTVLVPGTYTMLYESRAWGPGVPANTRGTFGCIEIE